MRSWNKKGEDEAQSDGMSSLVKIIVVVLFLVFFFVVGSKLYAAFFGVDKSTMDSFNGLADNFELMLQKSTSFEQYITTFVSNDEAVIAAGGCGETLCLCIYKNLAKYNDNNPWKCRNFDKAKLRVNAVISYNTIEFHSLREKIFNEANSCQLPGQSSPDEAVQKFGSKGSGPEGFPETLYSVLYYPFQFPFRWCGKGTVYFLYIEKYVAPNGKAFLSLGENLNQDTIDQRIATLSDCPNDSPDACKGVRRNTELKATIGGFCYYNTQTKTCEYIESFKTCEQNKEVTDSCLCGTQMIFKNSEYKYCAYRKPTSAYYALPFDCESRKSCSDYCSVRGSKDYCDNEEAQYCERNICDPVQSQKCNTYPEGNYIICSDLR